MGGQPFLLASFPRAILHVDGDAFFASVEQALHPELKGRPVVTGKERGIIACASYEAKARGIRRGVPLGEARRMCPDLVVLPSDYETYSLYSRRMFSILRRYTPMVEEHSVDEGFADLTGLRRVFRTSYEEMARRIQRDVEKELDITVSVGLSVTKSLAKLASRYRKPRGFTVVRGPEIHRFLPHIALPDVWGFGPHTVELLTKLGLKTAYDFACRPERWAERWLGKVGRDIWHELRGEAVYPVELDVPPPKVSISKGKTFTAPSRDRDFVYARLVRNVESAFIKLRRHRLRARKILVALRWQDFRCRAVEARLSRSTSATPEVLPVVRELFDHLFEEGGTYRATLVVLEELEEDRQEQYELFEDRVRIEKWRRVSQVVDAVNAQYGKHTLSFGPSLFLRRQKKTSRDEPPWRKKDLLPGETARQRLDIPRLALPI